MIIFQIQTGCWFRLLLLMEQRTFLHRYVEPKGCRAVNVLAPTSSWYFVPLFQSVVTHFPFEHFFEQLSVISINNVSCCWIGRSTLITFSILIGDVIHCRCLTSRIENIVQITKVASPGDR